MRSLLPLLLSLVACYGPGTDPDDFDPTEGDEAGESLDDDLVDGVDYRTYALLEVVSTLMVNPSPFGNETGTTVLTTYKHVAWEREDLVITWDETLCGLESTEIFGTQTIYPAALVDTFPVLERTGTLSEAAIGATFSAGPHVTVMGVELDDPMNDALPDSEDDPRVFDQDGDGHSGVTVAVHQNLLGDAEVYVAQREFNTFEGTVVSEDRVEGLIENLAEQVVLGASSWWANSENETSPNPDPSHSWFVFQQVGDEATCASILAEADTLFE